MAKDWSSTPPSRRDCAPSSPPSARMWTRRANAPPAESGRMGAAEAASFAPSPAKAGGKEGRLRAIGSRPDERHRAVLDGRTGWGGVSFESARDRERVV